MNIQSPIAADDSDYDRDFHAWLTAQAAALRAQDASVLDWENLAEEIETLGRSDVREIRSRLETILEHLLKLEYGLNREPEAGWRRTILEQRHRLDIVLGDSPSLKRRIPEFVTMAYGPARRNALASFEQHEPDRLAEYTARLPAELPYAADAILDVDYFPQPRG